MKTNAVEKGFKIERTFKAPPQTLWRMWTTKEGLAKWFLPGGEGSSKVTRLDVRVGGEYAIEMEHTNGQTLVNHGTYTEVVPNRRLGMLWRFDILLEPGEEPYDVVITVDFEKVPDGTKVTFTQGPLATPEHTEGSRQGVRANLELLAKAVGG